MACRLIWRQAIILTNAGIYLDYGEQMSVES